MFICEFCKQVTNPGATCHLAVTKRRKVIFPVRPRANRSHKIIKGKKKKTRTADPGGIGWQIEKEAKICKNCFLQWESNEIR